MAKLEQSLQNLWSELIDGPSREDAFVLNPGDAGLLRSLDALTAEQASAVPPGGGSSIAAHVDHLRFGLELLNRWSQGEQPFADANYSASWERVVVSPDEWTHRREALRSEAESWREVLKNPREVNEFEQTAIISSIVHLAYHFGAIRQINRMARGPSSVQATQH
ncbi:MAG TPA: DinB family protein [Bryobacteraceae bacterium]|jgi:hypothetical protein|nr:DinB family protein [Bryobacteraceae bacterium]